VRKRSTIWCLLTSVISIAVLLLLPLKIAAGHYLGGHPWPHLAALSLRDVLSLLGELVLLAGLVSFLSCLVSGFGRTNFRSARDSGARMTNMYNGQLPGKKEALARKLAGSSNVPCTIQQMADMLWLAGVKGNSITPDSTATVNDANAGAVYDNPSAG